MIADALAGKSRGIWFPVSIFVWIGLLVFFIQIWQPSGQDIKWRSWIEPDILYCIVPANINLVISCVFCILLSFLTQMIALNYSFVSRKSILPSYLSLLIGSILVFIKPNAISSTTAILILSSFYLLLDLFDNPHNKNRMFTVGILSGLAVIADIRALSIIILVWIILLLFRNMHWRMWVIALAGFIAPSFFCFVSIYLWYDVLIIPDLNMLVISDKSRFLSTESLLLIGLIILAMPVLISVFNLISSMKEKKINLRKYLWSTIFTALFFLILIIFTDQSSNGFLLYLLIMISSIILSVSLPTWRKKVFRELGMLYVISSVIVFSLIAKGYIVL